MMHQETTIRTFFRDESIAHLTTIATDLLTIEQQGSLTDINLVNKVLQAIHSINSGADYLGLPSIRDLADRAESVLRLLRNGELAPSPKVIQALLQATEALKPLLADTTSGSQADISAPVALLTALVIGAETSSFIRQDEAPEGESVHRELVIASLNPAGDREQHPPLTETALRVSVGLLDQLMNLAGELVLSRNQLLQTIAACGFEAAETVGQRIDLITSELQETIMRTRMQPVGNVFEQFPRLVRDLALRLGKEVELTVSGQEVELDKTIIETIGDPLAHLVRNALDHGIELPGERRARCKDPRGRLTLKAYHAAGQVVIEIGDDGQGIDGNLIADAAMARGCITAEQVKLMSDKERISLILVPGLSTTAQPTETSGRGLGMDMVKSTVDRLGGTLDINSTAGKGTIIAIRLPLTLAIVPCQIVTTGNERYAIPQANLEELLRIPASQVKERIERVGDAEVIRLRGALLPLVRMADVLGVERTYLSKETGEKNLDRRRNLADRRSRTSPLFGETVCSTPTTTPDQAKQHLRAPDRRQSLSSVLSIVVVSTGTFRYGMVVDRLLDAEEIVIKPLGRHLQHCRSYAGATIMGDGRIALIIDVANLARMAGLTSLEGSSRGLELAASAREQRLQASDRQSLLLFHGAPGEQFGMPLHLVERVEQINPSEIEHFGHHRVCQYRGGSLPLLRIDDAATVAPLVDQEQLLVIVFGIAGRDVGLLACGPVDATEIDTEIDGTTLRQTGIMGSVIVDGTTTLLVDLYEIAAAVHPEWFTGDEREERRSPTVLIVDDSLFFRNQVRAFLEHAGYHVLEAEDGVAALQLLETDLDPIAVVITDIEMPNMDGFELTRRIKGSSRFGHLPVIALTTHASEEDMALGKAAGAEEYHIKLDRERLVACVGRYTGMVVA